MRLHVVAPYDLTGIRCVRGTDGSEDPCTSDGKAPGHLAVSLDKLKGKEGVTLYASRGQALAGSGPALPVPPSGKADGTTVADPMRMALAAIVIALACAVGTIGLLRLAGRDRLVEEAPDGTPGRTRRVDLRRLAASLTPSALPPEGLTPAQGGILLDESVENRHCAAWLLCAAIDGHITIEGNERRPMLIRRDVADAPVDPDARVVFGSIFAGRDAFVLGAYDPQFASAWESLTRRLTQWQKDSGLWDTATVSRAARARTRGTLAVVLGFVATILGAWLGGGRATAGWPILAAGVIAVGAGLALRLNGWETADPHAPRRRPLAADRGVPPLPPRSVRTTGRRTPRRGTRGAVHRLGRGPRRDRSLGTGGHRHRDRPPPSLHPRLPDRARPRRGPGRLHLDLQHRPGLQWRRRRWRWRRRRLRRRRRRRWRWRRLLVAAARF
ncbi:DUF2207 family protein [Streptomyces griseus]|uniref:DUF2207 family protein n=1 Tax=Streptomyces griseus TaxID=1911 RepID=UPI00056342DF|nr:DUF2207 domain-containing protein [Streptomyces griseus]